MQKVDMQTRSDCYLACIATITGLRVADMPQPPTSYEQLVQTNERPTQEHITAEHEYADAVQAYLRDMGWHVAEINALHGTPRGVAIASGRSPRNANIWHSVVYVDGELWHDPHESRLGLPNGPGAYEVLVPLVGVPVAWRELLLYAFQVPRSQWPNVLTIHDLVQWRRRTGHHFPGCPWLTLGGDACDCEDTIRSMSKAVYVRGAHIELEVEDA